MTKPLVFYTNPQSRGMIVHWMLEEIGAPFISFFIPPEMLAVARDAGFREVQHVSAAVLAQRYFADRTDGLRPSSSEELLVATT